MTKTSQLIGSIVMVIVTVQIYGCKISRNLSSTGQTVTDRLLFIPVASTAILKQAATKVYEIDSLKDKTPVEINNLYMTFYTQADTLRFNFDKVTFHFDGDTLKFDELIFPKWDVTTVMDRMQCQIRYLFTTPSRSSAACIEGSFNVFKGMPTASESLRPCR